MSKPQLFTVDGIDYSPDGIEMLREAMIEWRGEMMKRWPEGIDSTVLLSHVIAMLSYLKEAREKDLC